jgi:hypothetical protein
MGMKLVGLARQGLAVTGQMAIRVEARATGEPIILLQYKSRTMVAFL